MATKFEPTTWVPVTGNTYPVREQLKSIGCVWNGRRKCWLAHPSIQAKAQAIVDDEQADTIIEYRFPSGHRATRRSGGRCEDAPCCGCCSI